MFRYKKLFHSCDLFDKFDPIHLEYGTEKRDRYDRVLAYLYTDDGELFNELLIREGLARVAKSWFPITIKIGPEIFTGPFFIRLIKQFCQTGCSLPDN